MNHKDTIIDKFKDLSPSDESLEANETREQFYNIAKQTFNRAHHTGHCVRPEVKPDWDLIIGGAEMQNKSNLTPLNGLEK